ncbi:hypothetical protein PoB_002069600 [Plakobranchus ocellatus]|uniref:Uncharacterized protein n=1 Tax=Plakobranchus ocellatus TaxID=259542 RepID=A0AAV3Z4H2_9GAST|nr:hypothetical protein PoB_002069600 [Plakobranchus ocellatus]
MCGPKIIAAQNFLSTTGFHFELEQRENFGALKICIERTNTQATVNNCSNMGGMSSRLLPMRNREGGEQHRMQDFWRGWQRKIQESAGQAPP